MRTSIAERAVLKSNYGIQSLPTLLLDVNATLIEAVPWQRAVTMLNKGSVAVLANYTELAEDGTYREVRIRSGYNAKTGKRTELALPFIVSLVEFVYDPYASYLKSNSDTATKRAILSRDEYRCAYCNKKADTVDHIMPQSRGGPNTWTNLIAACKKCNNKKANRTPEEAGMKLLWEPTKHDGGGQELQQEIWDYLMQEAGVL